jgi:hypothetical protein
MKRLLLKKTVKFYQSNFRSSQKILLPLLLLLVLSGFISTAQPAVPVVTVRFANPHYDCPTGTYCLDVEFISNTEGQQVYGMNVRFFYDDAILEFLSMGDFAPGYTSPGPPQVLTGIPGSGASFGIAGPLEWVNGTLQLVSFDSTIYLSDTTWTKLFNVCFHVDDPGSVGIQHFCPAVIWDLQQNPDLGGYRPGDEGVVITVVDPTGDQDSKPTIENVVQFNWQYDTTGGLFGHPVSIICVSTTCGYVIPLSNWSLFLAIGLMLLASVFIYRRRIS